VGQFELLFKKWTLKTSDTISAAIKSQPTIMLGSPNSITTKKMLAVSPSNMKIFLVMSPPKIR